MVDERGMEEGYGRGGVAKQGEGAGEAGVQELWLGLLQPLCWLAVQAVLQGCVLEGCGGGVWVWDSSMAWVSGRGLRDLSAGPGSWPACIPAAGGERAPTRLLLGYKWLPDDGCVAPAFFADVSMSVAFSSPRPLQRAIGEYLQGSKGPCGITM
ncbi:hypothetical protein HaLaN_08718 [Haematococcus lacustris]|uniref:Uncharacterized protein n=1 Tax=Haematococcus lacustris TaxID=44745 RepID=A0A699Z0Y6_HAELA|nr:hypothetical protein HaLaN_08718 [Haematococcus lacustris]